MKVSALATRDIRPAARLLTEYWASRGMRYSSRWAEQYLKMGHKVELKADQTLLLKEGQELCGIISIVLWEGRLAEIRDWVVSPSWRGKGCGKLLLDAALRWCRQQKARKVMALSLRSTLPVFEHLGFRQEGHLRDHFKKGEDLFLVSKWL